MSGECLSIDCLRLQEDATFASMLQKFNDETQHLSDESLQSQVHDDLRQAMVTVFAELKDGGVLSAGIFSLG